MNRREFLRYSGIALGAASLGGLSILPQTPNYERLKSIIDQYNTKRATGLLISKGPKAVFDLGLERYLIDPTLGSPEPYLNPTTLERALLLAGTTIGLYSLSQTKTGQVVVNRLTNNAKQLVVGLYDSWMRLYDNYIKGKLAPKQAVAISAILMLLGCGGGGVFSPTPSSKPIPGTLIGRVSTLDNMAAYGLIDFLKSTSGPLVATATIEEGLYKTGNIPDLREITRVRIRQGQRTMFPFLNTELNNSTIFREGENSLDVIVLDRKQPLSDTFVTLPGEKITDPTFYDRVNRGAPVQAPAGLKKVTQPLNFWADMSSNPGDRRADLSEQAAREKYPIITGFEFTGLQRSNSPPQPGNGNVIFTYNDPIGIFGSARYSGHRIDGGQVSVYNNPTNDHIELAAVLLFVVGSDDLTPSIANSNITFGALQSIDNIVILASHLETLGTTRATSPLDGLVIESYEAVPSR